jgi:hypothetical protein
MSRRETEPFASILLRAAALTTSVLVASCGASASTPTSPPCDQACQDGTAVRALRSSMKLAYNLTLQGKPVGAHDEMVPCPLGGTARVFGTATSNAAQGATNVDLVYSLDHCQYLAQDTDPLQTFHLTATGSLHQVGTLAVQPSSTTALGIQGDGVTLTGDVYDPAIPYDAEACSIVLQQDGNAIAGTICGRTVGLTL